MSGSYKDLTRRAMTGEMLPLESTRGELSFAPKKLSQSVSDEITELQLSVYQGDGFVPKAKKYRAAMEKAKAEGREMLTQDEALELIGDGDLPQMPRGVREKISRLAITNGVGQHDWKDDAGNLLMGGTDLPPEAVDFVLGWEPLAEEMTKRILEYSRPLAKTSSKNSNSSSTGDS